MYRSHSSTYLLALAALALAACSDEATPLAPDTPLGPGENTPAAADAERTSGGSTAGGRIVLSALKAGVGLNIFSANSDGTDTRDLTPTSAWNDHSPAVSPDGRRIAYVQASGGFTQISVMNADGSRSRSLISVSAGSEVLDPAWSPDGRQILFAARLAGVDDVNRDFDLYVMSPNGRNLRRLLGGPGESADDHQPSWSPDGTRIAFIRGITAPGRIMLAKADGSDLQEFATCGEGCANPAWAPDNSGIAYETARRLEVKSGNGLPRVLAINLRPSAGGPAWTPDASRLVYPGTFGEGASPRLLVVNRDGTGHAPIITGTDTEDQDPAWGSAR
jgi:Tol biopolymer transport system component